MRHNTWGRLYTAVRGTASSPECIQKRLEGALLELAPLQIRDFPKELQGAFQELINEMRKKGSIEASTKALSNEETSKVANMIVDLYDSITAYHCSPDR